MHTASGTGMVRLTLSHDTLGYAGDCAPAPAAYKALFGDLAPSCTHTSDGGYVVVWNNAGNCIETSSVMVVHPDGIQDRLRGKGLVKLFEEDVLKTEPGSQALIDFTDGVVLALNQNTTIKLLSRWEKTKGITRIAQLDGDGHLVDGHIGRAEDSRKIRALLAEFGGAYRGCLQGGVRLPAVPSPCSASVRSRSYADASPGWSLQR